MKKYTAEIFSRDKYKLAEGPYYDARFQRLSWVDIVEGSLHTLASDGTKERFVLGQMLGAAVPLQRSNGFIVAAQNGLYIVEDGSKELLWNLSDEYCAYQRSNDAKADPVGRLWFGSLVCEDGYSPGGNLYCYSKKTLQCMQSNTKISNGMAWSKDGSKFFFSDSLCYAVFVYDYDINTGAISNRKVLFEVNGGVPDGMCIDEEDNLWVAIWGGHRIECHSSLSGDKIAEISVPAEHVSSCCFYGDDLDTLFITTAGDGLSGAYDGCLFTCRVDSKGRLPDLAIID